MSVVGWARIIAGGGLLLAAGYMAVLTPWSATLFQTYHERLEYVGIGFDDVSLVAIPAAMLARLAIVLSFVFIGYRLLRNAEGTHK